MRLKKKRKAGYCRNLAIKKSKSDYVAFIDSDDIWKKEKLSKQLSFMIENKYNFTKCLYNKHLKINGAFCTFGSHKLNFKIVNGIISR